MVCEGPHHREWLLEDEKLIPHQEQHEEVSRLQIFSPQMFSSPSTLPITKSSSFIQEHKLDKGCIN